MTRPLFQHSSFMLRCDYLSLSWGLEDNYQGCYDSLADYAEELTTSTSEVPEHLSYYIDYDRMGRDMEMSGDIFTVETAHNEIHVFSNC
ncbi:antirestriction protein ArdA [Desulfogranum japonicum]|uniref:antirestriction protein ArdA n=1 Tax=Desulfogranum japonicum TaxID=231447 RepID=UPI000A05A5F1|nr:antirestriction protein ArdA [Desulfogranum japonicum]